jgi:peptidoglycan/LPS O-acetylase OafA/YrhL
MAAENRVVPADAASPSGTATPEKKRHRFLVLDGIRGLAIIGVLLTHASSTIQNKLAARLFQVGWSGVDLFFVLSGFLITGILIDTKLAVNRGRSFYARRILRIFPIYYLTLGIVLIAQARWAWIATAADMPSLLDRLSYVFYFKDLSSLWTHGKASQTMLGHFWSLAVEEQFYFVWPLLVWRLSTKAVYKLCGIALVCTLALRIIAGAYFGYGVWIQFFPLTRADGLFAGSALAALLASHYRPSKKLLAGFTVASGLGLVVVALTGYRQFFYSGPYMATIGFSSLAILFTVLIAYCLEFGDGTLPQALQAGWLRAFGRYSYGLYVFHLPVYYAFDHVAKDILAIEFPLRTGYSFLYVGLEIATSYGIAWISFNFFEERFLRLKRYFDPAFADTVPVKAIRGGEAPVDVAEGDTRPMASPAGVPGRPFPSEL